MIMSVLTAVFLKLLNMSYTACFVIGAVLLLRLALRRAPKVFSFCLWGVVLFRLLCPISFESALSPLPSNQLIKLPQAAYQDLYQESPLAAALTTPRPQISTGFAAIDQPVNDYLASTYFEGVTRAVGHSQRLAGYAALIWLAGLLILAGKSAWDFYRLRRSLQEAQPLRDNIWQGAGLPTAFVLGWLRPRIYLPVGLTEAEQSYILLHEQTHLRRWDHLWKLLAYGALLLHWFNPFVWLAYRLAVQDMEMACDEAVLRRLGPAIRGDYSASLLRLATANGAPALPLAFAEGGLKQRIKNALDYRRPTLWVCLLALLAVVAGCGWLAANPTDPPKVALSPEEAEQTIREQAMEFMQERIDLVCENTGLQITDTQLTDLTLAGLFSWPDMNVQVQAWQLNYRLRPADPANIPLMDYTLDDEGWIDWSYNLCQHMLLFGGDTDSDSVARPQFLKELDRLDYGDTLPSLENAAHEYLEQIGLAQPETFPGEHVIVQFPLSDGEVCQLLLSQPATQGEGGIWAVERWLQGNGNLYLVAPAAETAAMLTQAEYYRQLQESCYEGHQPWRLEPEEVAVDFIKGRLGQIMLKREDLVIIRPATWEDFLELPESHYFGYISNFDPEANITGRGNIYFHFDKAEWITDADTRRIAELNLDPDLDMPNGFYIHNPANYPMFFEADANTSYTYLPDGVTPYTAHDPAEFAAFLNQQQFAADLDSSGLTGPPPFHITTYGGVATEITQQYLP